MIPYLPNRQPLGIPAGGQFAARHRQEGSVLLSEARRAAATTTATAVAVGALVRRTAATARERALQPLRSSTHLRTASERARLAAAGLLLLVAVHTRSTSPAHPDASRAVRRHRESGSAVFRDARFVSAAVMSNAKDARIAVGNLVGRTVSSVRARAGILSEQATDLTGRTSARLSDSASTVRALPIRARYAVAGILLVTAASLTGGGPAQSSLQAAPDLGGTTNSSDA